MVHTHAVSFPGFQVSVIPSGFETSGSVVHTQHRNADASLGGNLEPVVGVLGIVKGKP